MKLRRISSTANDTVKDAARLSRKRNRYESRLFLADGEDLLDAALARGVMPRQVFELEGNEEPLAGAGRTGGAEVFVCSAEVMAKLSQLGSGSKLISVFEMPQPEFGAQAGEIMVAAAGRPLLYLAGVGDPGNVGTLIRSSSALGAAAVALGPDTADPYSQKSLRATMGAIFQIPVFNGVEPDELADWAGAAGVELVCADPRAGQAVWKAPLERAFVLVLGSEREGIPAKLLRAATVRVRIPQERETESMNVAMAGTAILFEAMRQRSPGRQ